MRTLLLRFLRNVRNRARLLQRLDPFFHDVAHRMELLQNTTQELTGRQAALERRVELIQQALGRIESRQLIHQPHFPLADYEFQVFSQWGEDGIIQFLSKNIEIHNRIFVEFGVEDYTEANTRFLLINNNWQGLVIDSSVHNVERINNGHLGFWYNLTAIHAFITAENINKLLAEQGITGDIGLLSIDIDGNDYWVWEAINVVKPAIVVVEYNHRFGRNAAVTIPYDPHFDRTTAHHSKVYFGASLKALCLLAERKSYDFVGCNSNGVNAFFVRRDLKPDHIRALSAEEGFVAGQFSEPYWEDGRLVKISPDEEQEILKDLPLVNVEDG